LAGAILVRDAMTKKVKSVGTNQPLIEAIQLMYKFNIDSIIVIQRAKPVGIITDRDIIRNIAMSQLDPVNLKAKDLMSTPLITIEENTTIEEAAQIMARKKIKRLPVLKGEKLVGSITVTDIAKTTPQLVKVFEDLMWNKPKP
jgi:CBS domain-containing protein